MTEELPQTAADHTRHEDRSTCAVLYARANTPQSLDAQLAECRRTAQQHGLTVLAAYTDYQRPARPDRLPGLQQLLADLHHSRNAAHIITFDPYRIIRNSADLKHLQAQLQAAGAQLLLPDGTTGIDPLHHPGLFDAAPAMDRLARRGAV